MSARRSGYAFAVAIGEGIGLWEFDNQEVMDLVVPTIHQVVLCKMRVEDGRRLVFVKTRRELKNFSVEVSGELRVRYYGSNKAVEVTKGVIV
jgi:hypothetical protein